MIHRATQERKIGSITVELILTFDSFTRQVVAKFEKTERGKTEIGYREEWWKIVHAAWFLEDGVAADGRTDANTRLRLIESKRNRTTDDHTTEITLFATIASQTDDVAEIKAKTDGLIQSALDDLRGEVDKITARDKAALEVWK